MKYVSGETVKRIEDAEGLRFIEIVARDDGRFQAHEFLRISAKEGGGWLPGRVSGIYASVEDAEGEARRIFKLERRPDYSAMTVNERLFAAGRLDEWDDAARSRNRPKMIELLLSVDLAEHAERIVDSILRDPKFYGF